MRQGSVQLVYGVKYKFHTISGVARFHEWPVLLPQWRIWYCSILVKESVVHSDEL